MPARNVIKIYVENGYYHIYNRGVEKRHIFSDQQDFAVYLNYLKEYLLLKDEKALRNRLADPTISYKEKGKIIKLLRLNNFSGEITLLAYSLMPNHFHILVQQKSFNSIDCFMQSISTRYTMYFNRKYKRIGTLFQAVYKAVLVETDEQLLHLTRYIHKQALASKGETLQGMQEMYPSSYFDYLDKRKSEWVHPETILTHFSKINPRLSYEAFIKQKDDYDPVKNLLLD